MRRVHHGGTETRRKSKHVVLNFWLGFILAISSFAQTSQSAAAPAKPVADRNAFTFTNYNLNITIEPARQVFIARGSVLLKNDSSTEQRAVALQISSSLKW